MVEHGVVVVAPKAGAKALALVIASMKGLSSISELDLTNQSKPDLRDHLSNIDEICPGSRRRSFENCFEKPLKVRPITVVPLPSRGLLEWAAVLCLTTWTVFLILSPSPAAGFGLPRRSPSGALRGREFVEATLLLVFFTVTLVSGIC
jgi:hypothetical protein